MKLFIEEKFFIISWNSGLFGSAPGGMPVYMKLGCSLGGIPGILGLIGLALRAKENMGCL
jgi:hypothetical protein